MSLVLLFLAVTLPMTAEEGSSVTVHQTEWGDTRGEAPPPSGPSVPIKADGPAPTFQQKNFNYGQGLHYGTRRRYGRSVQYQPQTRTYGVWRRKANAYQPRMTYRNGGGKRMQRSVYRPNIQYGRGIDRETNQRRYGLGK